MPGPVALIAADVSNVDTVIVGGRILKRDGKLLADLTAPRQKVNASRDYLVSKGVPRDKIETLGMGKTQPIPGVVCKQKNMKELIACYAPLRRVEVEVKGEATRR